MTKIIFTVTNDLNFDQRMIRICSTLCDAGYEVMLVGRNKSNSIDLPKHKFKQHRINCRFETGKIFYIEYNIRLIFFLLKNKFDIVGSVDLDTIIPGYFVSKMKSKIIVFDSHEMFTELPELKDRKFTKSIWKFIEKSIVPHLKYATTVNHSLQKYFQNKYKVPFVTIMNVPEKYSFPVEMTSNQPYIFYQGAVNKGRGLKELINVVSAMDINLKIAGNGDEFDDIQTLIRENKLENKVEMLGYLKPEELNKYTLPAHIGVNMLDKSSGNYFYSLANKFFDYIHAGVPQITMNFPEYSAINSKHEVAVLIDDLEIKTITNAIDKLNNDLNYYQTLKQNTHVAKHNYCWEVEKQKLIKFYDNII